MLNTQEKVISLYTFLKSFSELKMKTVTHIDEQEWVCGYSRIPNDTEDITMFFRDQFEGEEEEDSDSVLMKIHKPEFQQCPEPDDILQEWLYPGWDQYTNEPRIREQMSIAKDDELSGEAKELFSDNAARVSAYDYWTEKRKIWKEQQKKIKKIRDFFTQIYVQHSRLQSEAETLELVVGIGTVKDRENERINHPVLLRKIKIRFDAKENTFYLEDVDTETELYSAVFQEMNNVNLDAIFQMEQELHNNDYHPLDRINTPIFLKGLIHRLSSDSAFDDELYNHQGQASRLTMTMEPFLILRKRRDGTIKAIQQIIENIQQTSFVPAHIQDIVSGGQIEVSDDDHEVTIEEQLAAVGGEDSDILLSKEANKEQMEIARRIEKYNAVLVQGPPGTGKTHTIANLLGHFLAQGKSVLVTSHTKKALAVLKEKVAPSLQNLCVSVLGDSNEDMERSVDGITEYISRYTSHELKREMEATGRLRAEVISDLAEVRRKIYTVLNQESGNIVFNGESISPSKAAQFVCENAEVLSYIPGEVRLYEPLPVSFEELSRLYHSNSDITVEDEEELKCELPGNDELIQPEELEHIWNLQRKAIERIEEIEQVGHGEIRYIPDDNAIRIQGNREYTIENITETPFVQLKEYLDSFEDIQDWAKDAVVDGRKGGAYRARWTTLTTQIEKACVEAEKAVSLGFGKDIFIPETIPIQDITDGLKTIKEILAQKGKITGFSLIFKKNAKAVHEGVKVNGAQLSSMEDCDAVLQHIEKTEYRNACAKFWNELMPEDSVPRFETLDLDEPEQTAKKWIPLIQRYLDWYESEYTKLKSLLFAAGIQEKELFEISELDNDSDETDKILNALQHKLPMIIEIALLSVEIEKQETDVRDALNVIQRGKRVNSQECRNAADAICQKDAKRYAAAYLELCALSDKYSLQRDRKRILEKLRSIAPQWADAIEYREGIHGQDTVPTTVEQAWKWKQFAGIISNLAETSFEELQKNSLRLSREYREITAKYAEKSAWYHLLCRTEHDLDMRQALHGWKQAMRKVGKGTGKNAPKFRAEARKCMAKCQDAVPGWIMPVSKAMESLDPRKNQFDVIIIDEASQSDISSLAILYMAKKAIIVGDDKQVSPMAIGMDTDKVNALSDMYLKNIVRNDFLFTVGTSLYDIAGTTFQPLMLREHFRCVPDIIGFSNKLSYDFKIKPLRDTSDCTLDTAVINYRVQNGMRHPTQKTNQREAEAIVALLKACMEQSEYDGKTFGVISLLGDDQVKLIQNLLFENMEPVEMESRHLLCGNASNFQGDERDVIFLSMVDSNNSSGPLKMLGSGSQDSTKKRYNVAVSRARDQIWVVNSLDAANDLKPGDIRRDLLEYADNPKAFDVIGEQIEQHSESPFEEAVAKSLTARGYHLVQQWQVGAYRLDMVVICGNKRVAIECDGERYHSGEEKIREDMERQTILERLGWRFIRIRGSEYYRNPEAAMQRMIKELNERGIEPEEYTNADEKQTTYDPVLEYTRLRAEEILEELFPETVDAGEKQEVIHLALSNNSLSEKESPQSFSEPKQARSPQHAVTGQPKIPVNKLKPVQEVAKTDTDTTFVQKKKDVSRFDLKAEIKKAGFHYVDKRNSGGALWIIGGHELDKFVKKCRRKGVKFTFKASGGRATQGKAAWWTK